MNDYVYADGWRLVVIDLPTARKMVDSGASVFELVPVESGDLDLVEIEDGE